MDTAGWAPQKIGLMKPMMEIPPTPSSITTSTANNNCTTVSRPQVTERRVRPQKDQQALNCPRCNSTDTKFCYYNNYSLTQPRYFCKACRRYWTEGGSLRNVPVGGGSRKNKRSSSVSSSSRIVATASTITAKRPTTINAPKFYEQGQDPNQLSFQHNGLPGINFLTVDNNGIDSSNACPPVGPFSAMDLLRNGMISSSRSFGPFASMPMSYSTAFGLQELRPPLTLSFPFDGVRGEKKYGGIHGVQESGDGRMLFPFGGSEPVVPSSASSDHFELGSRREDGDLPGLWITGMMSTESGSG